MRMNLDFSSYHYSLVILFFSWSSEEKNDGKRGKRILIKSIVIFGINDYFRMREESFPETVESIGQSVRQISGIISQIVDFRYQV